MHIQFCGAAGGVTGSCTWVESNGQSILVDCGMHQGGRQEDAMNYEPFPFAPKDIDAVLVTHAHLDHCGRLPKLINQGFTGKIFSTDATRDIVFHILTDCAGIMAGDAEREQKTPLYDEDDVMKTMEHFVPLAYDQEVKITEQFSATLYNAGHVLGSSFIRLRSGNDSVIFSGDMGNYPVPLLPKAENLPPAEAIILESTYGDREHDPYEKGIEVLMQAIRDTVKHQGILLVPAFSLERTQELLTAIDDAISDKEIPQISAYVDSPLASKITAVYDKYSKYYNPEAQKQDNSEADHSLLKFSNLTFTDSVEQSKMINDVEPPKLIIAGSGMMHGGRILHHLKNYIGLPETTLLIVGYQAEGTLGREIVNGAKSVRIYGVECPVRAKVAIVDSFSSHMDQSQLLAWVETMPDRPKKIFLNHGEDSSRNTFAKVLKEKLDVDVVVPHYNEGFEV